MSRVSVSSPFSLRVQLASNSFARVDRSVIDWSAGCCVVFCKGNSHLPVSPRAFAASAAAAIPPSPSPASVVGSSTTNAPAFVPASSFWTNAVCSVESCAFRSRSVALSASDSFAPARMKR